MSRYVSFVVLVAIAGLVAFLFYKVIAAFILPLFLAAILVVIFGPLHEWFIAKVGARGHLAAGLTTATVLLIVLAPVATIFTQGAREAAAFYNRLQQSPTQPDEFSIQRLIAKTVDRFGLSVPPEDQERYAAEAQEQLTQMIRPIAVGGLMAAGKTALGLLIMIVALYFFLLDGPAMIDTVMKLSPLDDRHKLELLHRFTSVSRAIVVATLLAAVVQSILAGIAFRFVGLQPVFLLMALTMLLAMIPFVGAISVWLPCCLWLYAHDDNVAGAIGLALYGTLIISQVDNVIKPWVLHGRSKLHPLLALLSVLGGVQALGPIGILVGPMAVAFLQTLLQMVKSEIAGLDRTAAGAASANGPAAPASPLPADLRRIRMMLQRITHSQGKS